MKPFVLGLFLLVVVAGCRSGAVGPSSPASSPAKRGDVGRISESPDTVTPADRPAWPTPVPIPRLFRLTPPAVELVPYERELDPLLDELGVRVVEAEEPDGPYWQVVRVEWHDPRESGGRVRTFVQALDESGVPVNVQAVWRWATGETRGITPVDFIMSSGGCAYSVWVEDGAHPSERVECLGLGTPDDREYRVHVEYFVTFRLVR